MATPNQMPKRTNPLHQQILSGLLANKPASWARKTLVQVDGRDEVKKTTVTHQELRHPLAQNMSEESVERLAKRWIK